MHLQVAGVIECVVLTFFAIAICVGKHEEHGHGGHPGNCTESLWLSARAKLLH